MLSKNPLYTLIALSLHTRPQRGQITVSESRTNTQHSTCIQTKPWGRQLTSSTLLFGFVPERDLWEKDRGGQREVREWQAEESKNTWAVSDPRAQTRRLEHPVSHTKCHMRFLSAVLSFFASDTHTHWHTPTSSLTSSSVAWLSGLSQFYTIVNWV